jgi:hypothetical protein
MRAATSGVEAVDEAVDQAIDASMRGCLPTAKQSGVARVTTYFHVLTLSLEFPFSTHELTNHDPRTRIRLSRPHSLHYYENYYPKAHTATIMSSPAAQMGGSKGGKEPILFRFCSEWWVA